MNKTGVNSGEVSLQSETENHYVVCSLNIKVVLILDVYSFTASSERFSSFILQAISKMRLPTNWDQFSLVQMLDVLQRFNCDFLNARYSTIIQFAHVQWYVFFSSTFQRVVSKLNGMKMLQKYTQQN